MQLVSNLLHVVRSELSNDCPLSKLFSERHEDWGFDSFQKGWETTKNLEPEPPGDLIFSTSVQPSIATSPSQGSCVQICAWVFHL